MKTKITRMMTLLALGCSLLGGTAPVYSQSTSAATIVMSADQDETTFAGKWVWLIYTEAFKRLGLGFQLSANPMSRQSMLADAGQVDGEVARIHGYGAMHPNLIRVEEPVLDLVFSLYTANPSIRIKRIEELGASTLRAEYRRGMSICENALKQSFPAERLSDITASEQGAKKLLADRTDVYCDNEVSMLRVQNSRDLQDVARVRKLLPLGAAIPTYPYLHKKNAKLAPRLAAVLKKMKDEGLIETYRVQAVRDMGWTN
jgi:polar amino acid transport system substrate-binding protein